MLFFPKNNYKMFYITQIFAIFWNEHCFVEMTANFRLFRKNTLSSEKYSEKSVLFKKCFSRKNQHKIIFFFFEFIVFWFIFVNNKKWKMAKGEMKNEIRIFSRVFSVILP